ncbi:MAG: tRNA uridine-5-carboxymethylaminomethyl(34) synthesis enzyme MnmG [Candidatus Fimenecus sp.]
MRYSAGKYDVAVIGAGHAGIEAALAAAKLSAKTIIFTVSLDAVGNMPCNPSIGGTSKGHLVREIDALGGAMGKAADECAIQMRLLNRGKGPAVHSLRAQEDRRKYQDFMKTLLEKQENLDIKQAEIADLKKDGALWTLETQLGALYTAKCVILATGTYLGGRIYIGDVNYSSGPDGMFAANKLSKALYELNIPLRRFKTGTPARVRGSSIDFSQLEVQNGDEKTPCFSFETKKMPKNKAVCFSNYTNENTKKAVLENISTSPLYSGVISGVGPRYCPSFEDKVMHFPQRERHQFFIEPCGEKTDEYYLQGLSSSLPECVQLEFLKTIKGFENISVMRTAYAIEYDCVDPTALYASLEFIKLSGLYGAGQFNGSSGYEEAAAQGLLAGINAARKVHGQTPLILDRGSSYIGTLVDDLITKGCTDPYRMMTSRSEFRLYLRQDNADLRLTETGYEIGLISEKRYKKFLKKKKAIEKELERAKNTTIHKTQALNLALEEIGEAPILKGEKLETLLKRPKVNYSLLAPFDESRPKLSDEVLEEAEIDIKYEGYIKRQLKEIEEMRRLEKKLLPEDLDYHTLSGLRLEAREKLEKIRPRSVGQASRISGVNPADINVLLIYLHIKESKNA